VDAFAALEIPNPKIKNRTANPNFVVIPAKAGIQVLILITWILDKDIRG
jgi:hypothetical protein